MKNFSLLMLAMAALLPAQQADALRVCATTTDLGALATAVGGDRVVVTTFLHGPEDPHFLDARPNMIRACSKADALLFVGLELEVGWLPVLIANARNQALLANAAGSIDASSVIEKREVPQGGIDRSMGDVHAGGNPHFLADPRCGLQVALLLRDRFTQLRPADKDGFAARCELFRQRLCESMVGAVLAKLYDYDCENLAVAFERGTLLPLLKQHGDEAKLGGWFAALQPYRDRSVVADHDLWPYFSGRFGIRVVGFLEPKPGIAPTTSHLTKLVDQMHRDRVGVVLSVPYFDRRNAEFVSHAAGAQIAEMAHQVAARPSCEDYLATIDHNVEAITKALAAGKE
jgi:ABC-type Zn uptake system ZnuABC Zn-binding protein ZnuA